MAKLLDKFGQPYSDRFCTPKPLADLLPTVDIDPCSDPRSHIRAKKRYSLETGLNGLKLPWRGLAFVNYPYSDPLPWVEKLAIEMSEGRCWEAIVLVKLDCSTKWWKRLTTITEGPDLWMFRERLQFDEPPELVAERVAEGGPEKSSNNFCSVIVHLCNHSVRPENPNAKMTSLTAFEAVADLWVKP